MISKRRKLYLWTVRGGMYLATALTAGLTLFLMVYVLAKGIPHIAWELLSTKPSYLADRIGILPDILNTLYIIIYTLVLVLPLGVGAAIYLTEYAHNKRIVAVIEYAAETLSGIPSIIYGLVGMLLFSNNMGTSLLAGALTLVIMNLPTIMRNTQESLKTVPQSYREGALGLGATKWYIVRTLVLPCSLDGIVSGCILAVGRIVGESAALLFTAGTGKVLASSIAKAYTSSGATLSVALYMTVSEDGDFAVGYAIAAVLMVLVLCLNGLAKLARKKLKRDM